MNFNHHYRKLYMDNIIIVGFLLIALISCEKNDTQNPCNDKVFPLESPDIIGQIEYDLICQFFDNIVLQQSTDYFVLPFSVIRQEIRDLDSISYLNYVDNKMSYNLDSSMFVKKNIKLISMAERQYLIDNPDFNCTLDEFYKKYPDSQGLYTISRAGFNTDSTRAILSYGFSKPFYAMDVINYYKLVNNKWELTGSVGIHTQ